MRQQLRRQGTALQESLNQQMSLPANDTISRSSLPIAPPQIQHDMQPRTCTEDNTVICRLVTSQDPAAAAGNNQAMDSCSTYGSPDT
jgi:hypothetical protein